MTPRLISGCPKVAVGEARMMSHLREKIGVGGESRVRREGRGERKAGKTYIIASSHPPPS